MINKYFYIYVILGTAFGLSGPVVAAGLNELEDVTVRVLDLDEVPQADVQLIELPEPDLGELHDHVDNIKLPGRPVFRQSGAPDLSGVENSPDAAGTAEAPASNGTTGSMAPPDGGTGTKQ